MQYGTQGGAQDRGDEGFDAFGAAGSGGGSGGAVTGGRGGGGPSWAGDGGGPEVFGVPRGNGPPPSHWGPPVPVPSRPPTAPPPMTHRAPGPPHGGRRRSLVAAVAALVTGVLVAGLFVWSPWGNASDGTPQTAGTTEPSQDPADRAAELLRSAADTMEIAPVTLYRGNFENVQDESSVFELTVAGAGWSRGSIKDGGYTVRTLTGDGEQLVKADKAYWTDQGYGADFAALYSGRWLDATATTPDVAGLAYSLAPANVARLMRAAAAGRDVSAGQETDVAGVSAQRLYTPGGTYYVTRSRPYTLLRVVGAGTSDGGSLPEGLDATVIALGKGEQSAFASDFGKELGQLGNALDPMSGFRQEGKHDFTPCGNTSCTVHFKIKNSVAETTGKPVLAMITVQMTLDGKTVKTCTFERSIKENTTTSLTCKAQYSASVYSDHTIEAEPDAWARALSDDEIADLRKGFAGAAV